MTPAAITANSSNFPPPLLHPVTADHSPSPSANRDSRRPVDAVDDPVDAGLNSGLATELSHCSQMLA